MWWWLCVSVCVGVGVGRAEVLKQILLIHKAPTYPPPPHLSFFLFSVSFTHSYFFIVRCCLSCERICFVPLLHAYSEQAQCVRLRLVLSSEWSSPRWLACQGLWTPPTQVWKQSFLLLGKLSRLIAQPTLGSNQSFLSPRVGWFMAPSSALPSVSPKEGSFHPPPRGKRLYTV